MASVMINHEERKYPAVKIDDHVYFIMAGTYQFLHSEKIINEQHTRSGDPDRQIIDTGTHRWRMTLLVPVALSQVSSTESWAATIGVKTDLHTSGDKLPPSDYLDYWDITANEAFGGTKTHQVYLKLDWEVPVANDRGVWQIPVELWGQSV